MTDSQSVSRETREKQQPDSADFAEFVRSVASDLLGFFRRRVVSAEGAADCVGEVLLTVWRKRADLPPVTDERRAWVFGIAHHVLRNYSRSQVRSIALTHRLAAALLTEPAPHALPEGDQVLDALSQLKPADRELVLLVAWEGFRVDQAAAILGIRADAARARYSRARTRLATALKG